MRPREGVRSGGLSSLGRLADTVGAADLARQGAPVVRRGRGRLEGSRHPCGVEAVGPTTEPPLRHAGLAGALGGGAAQEGDAPQQFVGRFPWRGDADAELPPIVGHVLLGPFRRRDRSPTIEVLSSPARAMEGHLLPHSGSAINRAVVGHRSGPYVYPDVLARSDPTARPGNFQHAGPICEPAVKRVMPLVPSGQRHQAGGVMASPGQSPWASSAAAAPSTSLA